MKKSDTMLTLARVAQVMNLMPNELSVNDITIDECWEIWCFLDTKNRVSVSQQTLKNKLAAEYNVSVNRLDEVSEGKPLCEVLTWCSESDTDSNITLKQAISYMRNLHEENNKILDFCKLINIEQAELIWRWGIDYRWSSIKNRMMKWLKNKSGTSESFSIQTYLNCIYNNWDAKRISESRKFNQIKPYNASVIPKKWWFIPDLKQLIRVKDGLAKHRNHQLNTDIMVLLNGDEDCFVWRDALDTSYLHNKPYEFTFSKYKESLHTEWDKCQTLLESYSRGGFLIEDDEGNTFLKSNSTNRVRGQLMSIRNLGKGGYEFVIGFSDAGEIIDATTIELDSIPFSLEGALKRRGVMPNLKHSSYNIDDCLVVSLNYTWTTDKDWHLSFHEVLDEEGIDFIDEVSYYYSVVGEDEHD